MNEKVQEEGYLIGVPGHLVQSPLGEGACGGGWKAGEARVRQGTHTRPKVCLGRILGGVRKEWDNITKKNNPKRE